MNDEVKPRAVSGEIMAGPAESRASRVALANDVIDADYVSLPAGFGVERPAGDPCGRPAPTSIGLSSAPVAGLDMLRGKDGAPMLQAAARGGLLFWACGTGLVAAAFWISGGHVLAQHLAAFGGRPVAGALHISDLASRVDASGARAVLLVDGEAANDGPTVAHLPPLEIAVAGNDGRVTRYRLGTSGRPLPPGETFAFSSRLDVPKNGVKAVSVAFEQ